MIYLRATVAVYEAARAQMDAARGLPSRGQITSFDPADIAPRDSDGLVLLALRSSDTTATGAQDLLSQLLSSGAVEEIAESEYQAAIQTPDPLQG
jgi:hypothetical protein